MKNRRIAVISIVLVAVLCLGVGYAALTDDLSVTGNISLSRTVANDDFDMDVHFDAATAAIIAKTSTDGTTDVSKVTATVMTAENGDENDLLKITIPEGVLNFAGDKLTITADIINMSNEFDALIKMVETETTDDAHLTDVNCKFDGNDIATATANGGKATVTITITLKDTPTDETTNYNGDFSFAIGATSVEPTTP